jgi:ribonuclease T2
MVRDVMELAACAAVAVTLALGALPATVSAQNQPQNEASFDFYVLALSWSPSYCAAAQERGETRNRVSQPPRQCGERPYSFVVHGLWPQYEKGFPQFCQIPPPRLDRNIVSSMLDMMPSPRLVFHEWDRHGTCSGLSPRAYFETIRKARAVVKIPEEYLELKSAREVTRDELEEAFVKANPGLSRSAIAVTCDSRRLNEVRICLSKELRFRHCGDIDQRACRHDKLVMPPVRGS